MSPIQVACSTKATVLITGPTGTGKTTLAKTIHLKGSRLHKAFVSVNLASICEGTLESELFGHERGAFTSADQKRVGRFEMANGGTIFLDEIGELSPRLQARLLDFLQTHKVSPVGSNREVQLDVRVIAATNINLKKAIQEKKFREDLYHRLRVLTFDLKPLCERVDELDSMIHENITELSSLYGKNILKIDEEVVQIFERYSWPGNIRELRNVLECALLNNKCGVIKKVNLPQWFLEDSSAEIANISEPLEAQALLGFSKTALCGDYASTVGRFEKEYLSLILKKTGGRITHTAKLLGISKSTLMRRIHLYSINPRDSMI